MTRTVTLNAVAAGMTRLRTKGGASPQTLYDLTNGYVNASRCPQQRPGTRWLFNFANTGHTGNAGFTRGITSYKGVVYTFTHSPTYATSGSSSFVILVLRHPTSTVPTLSAIHFARPFMGFMYVVAEFSDGGIFHYWLQLPTSWKPINKYDANELVQPTAPNGYYYKAVQLQNPPAWTPSLIYAVNDVVQPTTYSGYLWKVLSESGVGTPPARSGLTEPAWINSYGAQVKDYSSSAPPPSATPAPVAPPATPPGKGSGGRYTNPGGGRGNTPASTN